MVDPPVELRLARLNKILDVARPLASAGTSGWASDCERTFTGLRTATLHLRKEIGALESVGGRTDVWQFIFRFSRSYPFHHERCNEVVRILMLSEAWMSSFNETGLDINDLPDDIKEQFKDRAEEVKEKEKEKEGQGGQKGGPRDSKGDGKGKDKGKERPKDPWSQEKTGTSGPVSTPNRPSNMAVVVQRISRARVLMDGNADESWEEVGPGIMISVSFAKGAKQSAVDYAAQFLLTAKLSTKDFWEPGVQSRAPAFGTDAESVANICIGGQAQGVVVLPQASIVADLQKDNLSLQYGHLLDRKQAEALYNYFVEALQANGADMAAKNPGAVEPKIVGSPFAGRQYMEVSSAGPFLHSFNF